MATAAAQKPVDTVVLCSGKIYYDLIERLEEQAAPNIAFVRVEQASPKAELDAVVQQYGADANGIWVKKNPKIWAPGRSCCSITPRFR